MVPLESMLAKCWLILRVALAVLVRALRVTRSFSYEAIFDFRSLTLLCSLSAIACWAWACWEASECRLWASSTRVRDSRAKRSASASSIWPDSAFCNSSMALRS